MLDSRYDPAEAERRIYARWEAAACFKPSRDPDADPYCIVIPPPNVTGVLHMGHALNNTLQDVLIRFQRMRGRNVLWQPGTDHAGIATQMVVERDLAQSGNGDRRSLGREAFVERVWAWKETSGNQIEGQLKRLGASCDWSKARFTMGESSDPDNQMVQAVRTVFVRLFEEGLIYRDTRLVNWDPHFQTAISDLEVENREVDGHFWHFRYPLENGETYAFPIAHDENGNPTEWETRDYISIATTRPETMLGDGAVAVHPDDPRYAPIVGKRVLLPLADRHIPIIADPYPDPEFGSGAVKITGAHDVNDYEVARRHGLPMHVIMDEQARMLASDIMPEKYVGLDRYEARARVVADIEARGLLDRVEEKTITQPFGDRSGVVIEPMLTEQWYVDAAALAKPAIAAVEEGRTRFVPETWTKTYYNWMKDIQPWCISRQLWWGHRIPAWYAPDGTVFVAMTEAEAHERARAHYGEAVELAQDEDVLDTWFSSALWPFSTQGWPEETEDLKTFYPTSTLVTAFDIIFFWVARMMMMGLKFMNDVPFRDVYIHALVLDEKGQKMSKSKGNVMDPLELIDAYGADALRFTMAISAAQGRNVKLSRQRVEGYRNFSTKLWNAARFCQMNECVNWADRIDPATLQASVNRWIVGELSIAFEEVSEGLEAYRFNEAASAAYRFVWNVFCDWYLELIKPLLNGSDEAAKAETRQVAGWVLDRILILLHPFMPFVTEELWDKLSEHGPARDGFLMLQRWPQADEMARDAEASDEMGWVIRLVTELRSVRADLGVPAAARLPVVLVNGDAETRRRADAHGETICRLARLDSLRVDDAVPGDAVSTLLDEATVALRVADLIDPDAERARLAKEIGKLEKETAGLEKKLANADFVAKAPAEVVEEQRQRLTDGLARLEKLRAAREGLGSLAG